MKKCFEKISAILILIATMLVLVIFSCEAMRIRSVANIENKTIENTLNSLSTIRTKATQIKLGDYISLGKYNGKNIIWK